MKRMAMRVRLRPRRAGPAAAPGEVPVPRPFPEKTELLDGDSLGAEPDSGGDNQVQDSKQLMQQVTGELVEFTFTDSNDPGQYDNYVENVGITLQFSAGRLGYDYEDKKQPKPPNHKTLLIPAAQKVLAHQQYLRGEVSGSLRGISFDKIQSCLDGLKRNRRMREEVVPFLLALEAQDSHFCDYLDKAMHSIHDNGLSVEIARSERVSLSFDDLVAYLSYNADEALKSRQDNQKLEDQATAAADERWQNAIAQGQVQGQGQGQVPLNPPAPKPATPPGGGVTTVGPGLQGGPPAPTPGQAQPPTTHHRSHKKPAT